MAKAKTSAIVTFWDSALGHTIRDVLVSAASSLVLVLINALQGVHLTGQWAQFAVFVPVLVGVIKGYLHVKDPGLQNLPTSLEQN